MNAFVRKYSDSVTGCLSGFDRLMLRGQVRALSYVDGLRGFLAGAGILLKDFGAYAAAATEALKTASLLTAKEQGRPVQYLESPSVRKDRLAQEIAARDRIREGLICVLSAVEPCRSFDINRNRQTKRLELVVRRRKGLFLYHYLNHPRFGFMHVRLQTWLPFDVQIWINGREWLGRELDRRGLGNVRKGNTFTWIENPSRAQELATAQLKINWPKHLDSLVAQVHPAHAEIFGGFAQYYYWYVYQSEWATDIMFRDPESLSRIYPRLIRHGITQFGTTNVMRFLGKRVKADGHIPANFQGEVTTDLRERPEGVRLKHTLTWNSLKLYDKEGSVLRVETTINRPQDFKVFRPKEGDNYGPKDWRPMRQGIADLHRRAQVSQAANDRYIEALASIEILTPLGKLLAPIAQPAFVKGRRFRALNPARDADVALLAAVNRGEHAVRGFRNGDIRACLYSEPATDAKDERRRSARISRLLRMLRAHGIIQKVQRTHRYMLTPPGRQLIAAVLAARDTSVEALVEKAA